MTKFTKEQLIARVKQATAINRRRISANPDAIGLVMDNELFAIALAALTAGMEQEPIYQLRDVDWYDTDKRTYDTVVNAGGAGRIVYAAPQLPQPSVPEELLSLAEKLVNRYVLNKDSECEFIACITPSRSTIGMGGVWDEWKYLDAELKACRAAMLHGAEPVQPYTLRDGWVAVPVEPTPEMREAYHQAQGEYEDVDGLWSPDHQWQDMLAAAPQQEVK